jgi:hypothetical protein
MQSIRMSVCQCYSCDRHNGVDVLNFESTVRRERWRGFVIKKRILKLVQALRYVLHGDDNIKIVF